MKPPLLGDWGFVGPIYKEFQDGILSDKNNADLVDILLDLGCDPQTLFVRSLAYNYAGDSTEAVLEVECGSQHKWIYGTRLLADVQSVFSENPII